MCPESVTRGRELEERRPSSFQVGQKPQQAIHCMMARRLGVQFASILNISWIKSELVCDGVHKPARFRA